MNEIKDFETVRLFFSKWGKTKFISHLDLNRTMIRAIRRTNLPIWYTEGFNKHPYVTFVSPLSLGYESNCECMDFRLNETVSYETIVSLLNEQFPEGLTAIKAGPPINKAGKLGFARYRIAVPCNKAKTEEFLAQNEMVVEKRTKKGLRKEVDIRPYLQDVSVSEEGEQVFLKVTLPCNSETTINPSLLTTAMNQFLGEDRYYPILRLQLFDLDGKIFE